MRCHDDYATYGLQKETEATKSNTHTKQANTGTSNKSVSTVAATSNPLPQ
jgi:hypothetical protein